MIVALPVLMLTGPDLSAQTADRPQASDSSKTDAGKTGSFYAGGGYGSNMIYLGSTMSQDNPYGYASLHTVFAISFLPLFLQCICQQQTRWRHFISAH